MNKTEIRKQILKKRKFNYLKNFSINFNVLDKILKKNKIKGKILGGYYAYNHELDPMKILEKFESLNYQILLPKIKKKFQMDFFAWSTHDPLIINKKLLLQSVARQYFVYQVLQQSQAINLRKVPLGVAI